MIKTAAEWQNHTDVATDAHNYCGRAECLYAYRSSMDLSANWVSIIPDLIGTIANLLDFTPS